MSLEQRLAENTAALHKNSDRIAALIEMLRNPPTRELRSTSCACATPTADLQPTPRLEATVADQPICRPQKGDKPTPAPVAQDAPSVNPATLKKMSVRVMLECGKDALIQSFRLHGGGSTLPSVPPERHAELYAHWQSLLPNA